MSGQRCEYKHGAFDCENGWRCDGTGMCWVTETHDFRTDEKPHHHHRCLLHAPESELLSHEWPLNSRGKDQSTKLKSLIGEWRTECDALKIQDETAELPAFVLPGFRCGDISFAGDHFPANILFDDATFSGNTSFDGSTFHSDVGFVSIEAKKNFSASNVSFRGKVNFTKVNVTESFRLFASTIYWHLRIEDCRFVDKTDLKELSLQKYDCEIVDTQFKRLEYSHHGDASMSFFNCPPPLNAPQKEAYLNFSKVNINNVSFHNMDLSRADFRSADIKDTRFVSCKWDHGSDAPYAKASIHDELIGSSNVEKITNLQSMYRALKKNHEENHDYNLSGEFHYREMECRQEIIRLDTNRKWWQRSDYYVLGLYKFVSDYGQSYWKLLGSLFGSVFLTTFFIVIIEKAENTGRVWRTIWTTNTNIGETMTIAPKIWDDFTSILGEVFLKLLPSPYQKSALTYQFWADSQPIITSFWSKIAIGIETLIALTIVTLFVMAVRRRFRR